jgi:CPA2 family monovalent cation:H+ antiporter-2
MGDGGLIVHLVTALGAALVGAAIASRLRQPLILGYLAAGVAIGPFTPGIIGEAEVIAELAETGIVFLMFVIGVQLSLKELLRESRVAILGGSTQVVATRSRVVVGPDLSSVLLVAVLTFASPSGREIGPLLGKAALFFCVVVPVSFWAPWSRASGSRRVPRPY